VRVVPTPSRLFALAVAGQFIFGIVLALPGTLFGHPAWTAAVGLDVAAQANLLAIFFTGQLLCTAVAGVAVDHAGAQRVIAAGGLLLLAGFEALGRAGSPGTAAVALALLAAGGSSINAATNTLVSVTFGERRGAMLSMMGLAGAIGAFTAPLVVAGSAASADVADRVLDLAVAAGGVALLPLLVADAHARPAGISFHAMRSLVGERPLASLIALLSVEFGLEAVLAGWSGAYALAVLPGARAGLIVALYWGGLCLGRAATPAMLTRTSRLVTVTGASTLACGAAGAMALAPSPLWLGTAALVAGIAVGPLAPTLISVAGDRYPRRTGLAIGVLLSVAQVGGMVLPWITGRAAIAAGFRVAMTVPALAAALLAVAATMTLARLAAPGLRPTESA
jgi:FHS family L-fucose permease-like MFS transporter